MPKEKWPHWIWGNQRNGPTAQKKRPQPLHTERILAEEGQLGEKQLVALFRMAEDELCSTPGTVVLHENVLEALRRNDLVEPQIYLSSILILTSRMLLYLQKSSHGDLCSRS
jgi:hypothetical protein